LASEVQFSKKKRNIKIVCLPFKDEHQIFRVDGGSGNFSVAGWGKTETGTFSDELMKVTVPYLNHEQCTSKFNELARAERFLSIKIHETQLCAGASGNVDT
jgi:Trypsin